MKNKLFASVILCGILSFSFASFAKSPYTFMKNESPIIGGTLTIATGGQLVIEDITDNALIKMGPSGATGSALSDDGTKVEITQNSVQPFTSVASGAVDNTLYLKEGNVGIGITPLARLHLGGTMGSLAGCGIALDNDGNSGFYAVTNNVIGIHLDGAISALFSPSAFKVKSWRVINTNDDLSIVGAQTVGQGDAALSVGNEVDLTSQSQPVFTVFGDSLITPIFTIHGNANVGIGTTDLDGTPPVGKLTAKGSDDAGATNIFVGRDSNNVNKVVMGTNGMINTLPETVTCISESGTADPTVRVHFLVSDGDADNDEDTVSLTDGVVGDEVIFTYKTNIDGGDSVNVTPAHLQGGAKILFNAVGQGCHMVFDGTNWVIVGNNGGTIL